MLLRQTSVGAALAILVGLAPGVLAQQRTARRDFDAEYRAAVQSAKDAAGFEFLGTLARTCLLPQSGGENDSDTVPNYIVDPSKAPKRETWYAEPAKVFDNLYFVGGKVHSSWALTTSDGIILIDTIFPYNSEELIVGGMQKLGLDPKQIKYIIISHAHSDHIGGAEILQKKYGARVVMGAPNWDTVAKFPNRYKTMAPKRDIVATDGMKITLGGRTVTIWLTPGHTPGAISGIFQVHDHGKPLTVAYSGGTEFNFVNDVPHFDTYLASVRRFAAIAAAAGATIIMGNQSQFDSAAPKLRMLADRRPGEAHPLDVGAAAVARYFRIEDECAQAVRLKLLAQQHDVTQPRR